MSAYLDLKQRYENAHTLGRIGELLVWDERVMMPPLAGSERARMLQVLHDVNRNLYLPSVTIKELMYEALAEKHTLDDWDQRNLEQIIDAHDDPPLDIIPNLRSDLRNAEALCRQLWAPARNADDWDRMADPFAQVIYDRRLLNTEIAAVRNESTPYDISLSSYSRRLRTRTFDQVTDTLLPRIREILASHPVTPPSSFGNIAMQPATQLAVMRQVMIDMSFDFGHGRLDESPKAFFGKTDQDRRIVTRVDPLNFMAGLSSTIHETGHALHYQNLPQDWVAQPVGRAGDFCMREALAMIWQIYVAQTPEFCTYIAHHLQDIADITIDPAALYAHHNTLTVSPLRVGSDPVHYALHILIRYQIERDLINGQQDVPTLPLRWAQDYHDILGVTVPDHKNGVLQDIHWFKGSFGYFPCYLLALLYGAQLFRKAEQDIPNLRAGFAEGRFMPLVEWLRKHVYSWANYHDGLSLLEQATGEPLNALYFIDYLHDRYKTP